MKKHALLSLMVLFACAACLLLTGCGQEGNLEKSAVPVVNDIIRNQLDGDARCLAVKITRKVDAKHYKALATLDNGHDLNIMIEDRGDQILVTVPLEQD